MQDVFSYIDDHRDSYLKQLFPFLRQPSISTQNVGVRECAQMLLGMLKEIGAKAKLFETPIHPIVFGEIHSPGVSKTLLVYGHYDVQPPDPVDLWKSPPFEPTVCKGRVYGRGTADNKGQLFAHIKAAEALLRVRGKTASNIKFLFEGEEEISSPSLRPFIETHQDLLKADACLVFDGSKHESSRPTIVCGLKGMLYIELRTRGANRDLHSMRAAMIPSPVWRLVHALASLKNQGSRVLFPGFYDLVRKPEEAELEAVRNVPSIVANIRRELDVDELLGGDDSYYYNMMFDPTCNISGIQAGYTGPGAKTVLPCQAFVKLDFRLVPDQRPQEVLRLLKKHLDAQDFNDIEIVQHGELMPSRTPVDHPYVQLVAEAILKTTGQKPVIFPSMGGSGPDYFFTGLMGFPSVWLPLARHDSNNHAPNENIVLDDFLEGIKIGATIIEYMGRIQ